MNDLSLVKNIIYFCNHIRNRVKMKTFHHTKMIRPNIENCPGKCKQS